MSNATQVIARRIRRRRKYSAPVSLPARSLSHAMTSVRSATRPRAECSTSWRHLAIRWLLHSVAKWKTSTGEMPQSGQGRSFAAKSPSAQKPAKRGDCMTAAPVRAHMMGPRRDAAILLRDGMDPEQSGPCALKGVKSWWLPSDAIGAR